MRGMNLRPQGEAGPLELDALDLAVKGEPKAAGSGLDRLGEVTALSGCSATALRFSESRPATSHSVCVS